MSFKSCLTFRNYHGNYRHLHPKEANEKLTPEKLLFTVSFKILQSPLTHYGESGLMNENSVMT